MASVRMFRTSAFCLLPFALTSFTSCARPAFHLPPGPGVAAPEASAAWTEATRTCRGARVFSAELRLSGRAGTAGRIKARALAGLTDAGEIRLEVPAPFGRPVFVLAGASPRATFLSRDNGVLTAPAEAILEALVGLSLQPQALLALLSGCGLREPPTGDPVRYGDLVAIGAPDARVFLSPTSGSWRVIAAQMRGWIVDYRWNLEAWPAELRIRSTTNGPSGISLSIAQHQVEINTSIPPSAFHVVVPAGATPLTLDDLRAAGPLGDRR